MGRRRPNPRLVKIHRSYTVEEAARTLGVHKNTVRAWIRRGLGTIDRRRPTLVHGLELRGFIEGRRAARKQACAPGQLFCVRCRSPKPPAGNIAEYIPMTATSGNLRGICADCDALMHRRVAVARLNEVRGDLKISSPQAAPRIGESIPPSENCESNEEGQSNANS